MCKRIRGRFARTASAALVTTLLAGMSAGSHAAVGAKLIVQGWEPWNANPQPTVVAINDPNFISGPLSEAWVRMRGTLCDAFKQGLGRRDMLHPGVTLYAISCQFNAADIRLLPVSAARAKLVVLLPASKLSATSTTPSLAQLGADAPLVGNVGLPGGADPRFSVSVDARLELDVEIGDAPHPFLTVRQARMDIQHANARGENISGKVAEWVASKVIPFFGGPNFERMGEAMIDGLGVNITAQVQQALSSVNARVAAYAQYVRVQTWMSPSRIAIALQPRNLPAPPLRGEMRGVLRDQRGAAGTTARTALCQGFRVTAAYQAGPAPIINPDTLETGPATMAPVGAFSTPQPLPDGSCAYAVTGLAYGVMNRIQATHPLVVGGSSGSLYSVRTVLLPQGWHGTVTPRPSESNRDYVLATDARAQLGVGQPDLRRQRIDPIIDRARMAIDQPNGAKVALNPQPLPPRLPVMVGVANPQTRVIAKPSAGVSAIGSAVALNPQPLPPRIDPTAPVTTTVLRKSSSAGAFAIGSVVPSAAAARAALVR